MYLRVFLSGLDFYYPEFLYIIFSEMLIDNLEVRLVIFSFFKEN